MRLDSGMQWSAIVPVKASTSAKSRLGTNAAWRTELSRAFLGDVLDALVGSSLIQRIIVVTDDTGLKGQLAPSIELKFITSAGLNEDISSGIDLVSNTAVAVITGDLPCLTTPSIDCVLQLAGEHQRSFVSDSQGLGTTMLLTHEPNNCQPMFGFRSHAKHAQAGYHELISDDRDLNALLIRARRDVDTAIDLWDARRLGVGANTSALLDDL
jgi:2-phospho-L-lactate/phosphoenolpyruvate guanylyltransferase